MAFEKGNNLGKGRPKGAQNKSVAELRSILTAALSTEILNLAAMLGELETEKRLEMLAKFIGYVLPKPIEAPIQPDAETIQPPNVTITRENMSINGTEL